MKAAIFNGDIAMKSGNRLIVEGLDNTSSDIVQYNGEMYFRNFSQNGNNRFYYGSYDTQATPVFDWRMFLRFDALNLMNL